MDWADWGLMPPLVGLVGGILLGLAARRGRFCTLGAIEDALYANSWNRVRMWAVALAVSIAGTFLMAEAGMILLEETLYVRTVWNPVASIVGGLIFGYGMAIAGNCGYGALARLGGGDLRSLLIVIAMGVTAYIVLSGPLASLRLYIVQTVTVDQPHAAGYAHLIASAIGLSPLWPALVISAGLAIWALSDRNFTALPYALFWGMVVGLAIISGWAGTSYLSQNSFQIVPTQSHSFTAPAGETMLYLMTGSAGGISFAIGSVAGVVLGAVIGSVSEGHFRWEACDDPQELGRQIWGGALMGIGGILALGCSVGQGLSAFSVLSFSAPIVLVSIFVGAALGLRQLIRGFESV